MNLSTFIVLMVLVVIVVLDIRYLMAHGLDDCGGDCSSCGPSCKWVGDIKKAQRKIAFQKKIRRILHVDAFTKKNSSY